jgi:DNA polymerase-1
MRTFSGSLSGRPWDGWMPERPEELAPFLGWVRDQREPVAVDTEGKGLDVLSGDPEYVRLVQFGTETEAWVIPVELGSPFRAAARDALEILPDITGHNWGSFDAVALAAYLHMDLDALCRKGTDTQVLAKLLDPRAAHEGGIGARLKQLSARFIDPSAPDTQEDLTAVFRSLGLTKATGWAGIDLFHPVYCEYAALDVILTSRLRPILLAELERVSMRRKLVEYEHEISRICAHMQYTGMVLDCPYTESLSTQLAHDAHRWSAKAAQYGVENVNAPAQLRAAFLGMGETWSETTDGGDLSVAKQVLHRFADLDFQSGERLGLRAPNPLAEAVITSKRSGKWRSTYAERFLETVDRNGRVHPSINTLQARTGRMSITRPALQTLPKGDWMIRRALLADEGHVMISCDFASVEMRVMAALASVKKMKEAIGAGKDLNDYTASLVYGPGFTEAQRQICKGVGYGTIYGGGADTISEQTGAPVDQVREAQRKYHRMYPEIRRASRAWQREARETGMVHLSATGRRLPLDRHRAYAVVNYAVQSTARDVLGQSLLNLEEAGLLPYMRLPVHDEVLCSVPEREAPEFAREIEKCMNWTLMGVPIEAEAKIGGRSWGSLLGADE